MNAHTAMPKNISVRFNYSQKQNGKTHVLEEPRKIDNSQGGDFDMPQYITDPFPFGFDPTFHRDRLGEPRQVKTPSNIFVVSMGDLFGSWVPLKWIVSVIDACLVAPQHNYIFLTKNPARYKELQQMALLPQTSNFWYGTTLTNNADFNSRVDDLFKAFSRSRCKTFISVEPLHERISEESFQKLYMF